MEHVWFLLQQTEFDSPQQKWHFMLLINTCIIEKTNSIYQNHSKINHKYGHTKL